MGRSGKKYSIQFLVERLWEHGLSEEETREITVRSGISPTESNISMTLKDYLNFFNEAALKCDNPCLGLQVGSETRLEDFGYVGLLGNHSATLRDSWLTFERYLATIFPEMVLRVTQGKQSSQIEYDVLSYSPEEGRQDVELSLASIVRFFRAYAGETWAPHRVLLKHGEPANKQMHASFFATEVKFNQPVSALVFDSSALDVQVSKTDPELLRVMREHADEMLANIGMSDNVVSNVRYQIVSSMGAEGCDLGSVAKNLFVSQRTLKRQLANLGTSFRKLKLSTMEDLAKRSLMETSTSISQIALTLGYSETAAFIHAFKNVTGLTPSAYRKIAQGGV
jgi:AraC-like DNA-binding protein